MKKIISLFKRDYEGTRLVYNEVVEGAEWVINGEGIATEKFDGTCCMIKGGRLYKRYDRKPSKTTKRKAKKDKYYVWGKSDFPDAPDNWIAAESEPNLNTGHWPGWLPVDANNPSDKWHISGLLAWANNPEKSIKPPDGTYELVGEKVQGNPYSLKGHELWRHGSIQLMSGIRSYDGIFAYLLEHEIEGIVWHHSDGRMVKIKRRDFGLDWPIKKD